MFNPDQAIKDWRQRLVANGIKSPAVLDELESHLREEIERRIKSGVGVQRALDDAIQQIGKADTMKNEFEKVDGAEEARNWRLKQIIFFVGLGVISLFVATCLLLGLGSFSEMSRAQQMSGLAALALMISLAGGGYFCSGLFPVIVNKRLRDAICISSAAVTMFWWAIFFFVILQCVNYTTNQLVVAVLWGFVTPFGALAGFVIGLEKAARESTAT
jgi:cation transport ATPase